MSVFARDVLSRLPLAEGILTVWHWLAEDTFLNTLFAEHRGRCYEKELSFATLVQLIHEVLIGANNSANERFNMARTNGQLEVHGSAVYQKLGRLPLPLSAAFLAGCTQRLRDVIPESPAEVLPACLDAFTVVAMDGKTIKNVAKRLKATRVLTGRLLGGRALVAQDIRSGLAIGMHGDADGEANDVRFVPDLVPAMRAQVGTPILWVADAQFGFPEVLATQSSQTDRFLVRYHGNVKFTPDAQRPNRSATDAKGRAFTEQWGWLGGPKNEHRRYVRRIRLELETGKPLVLVSDLLDGELYPAMDLLEVYRRRWGIENVFQQITEVFGLARLIGHTPEATVFQLSFCLVLYNVIQAIRCYVAQTGNCAVPQVSGEKVFRDVKKELISWRTVLTAHETLTCFAEVPSREHARRRLQELLGGLWRPHWAKAKPKKKATPHPTRAYRRGEHKSIARVLAQQKQIDRPVT